jgi:hypothetical protein
MWTLFGLISFPLVGLAIVLIDNAEIDDVSGCSFVTN